MAHTQRIPHDQLDLDDQRGMWLAHTRRIPSFKGRLPQAVHRSFRFSAYLGAYLLFPRQHADAAEGFGPCAYLRRIRQPSAWAEKCPAHTQRIFTFRQEPAQWMHRNFGAQWTHSGGILTVFQLEQDDQRGMWLAHTQRIPILKGRLPETAHESFRFSAHLGAYPGA